MSTWFGKLSESEKLHYEQISRGFPSRSVMRGPNKAMYDKDQGAAFWDNTTHQPPVFVQRSARRLPLVNSRDGHPRMSIPGMRCIPGLLAFGFDSHPAGLNTTDSLGSKDTELPDLSLTCSLSLLSFYSPEPHSPSR